MRFLIAVAFVALTFGIGASGCHEKNQANTPANAPVDAGPPAPEHHYPRE
jgi:hypothetical protein